MDGYQVPARQTQAEIFISNSHFIATLSPAFSVKEAQAFIAEIREQYQDATHNVPAFLIGSGASVIAHCNDDGEPSGTAGKPALAVLRGSDLGDAAVVITRYFGGTKLGTGGLVRAYSDAVRAVLEITPRALKTSVHVVAFTTPYSFFEPIQRLIKKHQGTISNEEFGAQVTLTCRLPGKNYPRFQAQLQELTSAKVIPEIIQADQTALIPLPSEKD
jgi:uncharacterized YigZ family protein